MYNILVTGANGQLGSEIKNLCEKLPEFNFFFTAKTDLDITKKDDIRVFIADNQIQHVINCAAYTAVDKAETESELANKINNIAVGYLAEIAKEKSIRLIHISTDYVFNGKNFKPYLETDSTTPINIYGQTKLSGEETMRQINPDNSLILRTSWVYSSFGNNFVKTMLRLGEERDELNVISDQIGSPTYARDLAEFILNHGINRVHHGVKTYHFTNQGVCSWYDFAVGIMDMAQLKCRINPIPSSQYPTLAQRPFFSVLDKNKLSNEFNFTSFHWKESLKRCTDVLQTLQNL